MENLVNTFYKGNINKFGFGGWNTQKIIYQRLQVPIPIYQIGIDKQIVIF